MVKPATFDGYSDQHTVACERVLVTLLRGLGPWNESVFLVVERRAKLTHPPGTEPDIFAASRRSPSKKGYRERKAGKGGSILDVY